MKEQELRKNFANNLIYYRKANGLTQLELANLLNYSDKAVSKWERGESFPDVYTLTEISRIIGVTPNDLLSERIKTVKHPKDIQTKLIICLLSIALVWLVATVVYVVLALILGKENSTHIWLAFIYAIPLSAVVAIVFTSIWKNTFFIAFSSSVCLWTVALSLHLSLHYLTTIEGTWLLYALCIPVQILFILWFIFKYTKNRKKIIARKRFLETFKPKDVKQKKKENKDNLEQNNIEEKNTDN